MNRDNFTPSRLRLQSLGVGFPAPLTNGDAKVNNITVVGTATVGTVAPVNVNASGYIHAKGYVAGITNGPDDKRTMLVYDDGAGFGYIQAYDFTNSQYKPLHLIGSDVQFHAGAAIVGSFQSDGLHTLGASFTAPIGVGVNTNGADVAYFTKPTALAASGFYGIAIGAEYGTSGSTLLLRMTKDGSGNYRANVSTYNAAAPIDISAAAVNYTPGGSGVPQEIGFRGLRERTTPGSDNILASDNGRCVVYAGGDGGIYNLGANTAEALITIKNGGTGYVVLTQNANTIYWFTGAGLVTGNRTLVPGGIATCHYSSPGVWHVWGSGLS
jgi:hypothetical protein